MKSRSMKFAPVPRCFASADQFALWNEAATQSPPGSSAYCTDCTPEFKREMRLQRRCAHPLTRFFRSKDGELFGARREEFQRRGAPVHV